METKELPQSMFDDAVQEIVTTRTENGFLTPDKELNAAVRVHIKMQLSKTMLDMFYRGELRFTEENGEDLVCNTTPEETRKRCAISKKPVEAAFLWGAYNDPGPKTAARITFKCSGCGKRQTVHHTQLGNIPLPLKVKCKLGHETLVIPYHWDGRPEIGGHNVEN